MTRSTSSHILKRLSYDTQPKIGQISSHGRAMSPEPTIPNDILITDPLSTPKIPFTAEWVTNKESFTHIHLTHQLQTQMLTINSNLTTPHREHPEKRGSKNSRLPQPILSMSLQLKCYCGRSLNYAIPYPEFQHRLPSHMCTIYIFICWQSKFPENSRVPSSNLVSESAPIWKLLSSLPFYLAYCYALSRKASINPPLQSPHIGREGPP
jgi:hypothetical protein